MNIANNIIQPAGILDGTRVEELREQVEQILQASAPVVLIDLQETTFIDSSGLGALVSTLKAVRAADRKLYFCSPNAQIKIVFELSGMDQAFEVFDDRAAFEQAMLSPSL
ncbi:MAG: STAS domain-containing protein [Synechococcales cyanobacterium RM1_1_8]|nr:STAS domain-containing protein [Synechococcales cyanobacterium RM1_1_8]